MYTAKQRYSGDVAEQYEARRDRRQGPAWFREYRIMDKLCKQILADSSVLDIPCGTGRLFPLFHEHGQPVLGADVSLDMLRQIPESRVGLTSQRGLAQCDAEHLPFPDGSFDYVVCLRLFHLGIPEPAALRILAEFARVARKGIILHIRFKEPSLFAKAVGTAADMLWARSDVPLDLGNRVRRTLKRLRSRPVAKPREGPGASAVARQKNFFCTLPYFESLLNESGFRVTKSYGAISALSSKRIYLIEKSEPGK